MVAAMKGRLCFTAVMADLHDTATSTRHDEKDICRLLCSDSRRCLGFKHHFQQALHGCAPLLKRGAQAPKLLLSKLALQAARDNDGRAYLIHLGGDQTRRDGLNHPMLNLVHVHFERFRYGSICELFVNDAQRSEREQAHFSFTGGMLKVLLLHEGLGACLGVEVQV
eukprot:scaffold68891_cov32-Tisochrysis_lutea.AAC.2